MHQRPVIFCAQADWEWDDESVLEVVESLESPSPAVASHACHDDGPPGPYLCWNPLGRPYTEEEAPCDETENGTKRTRSVNTAVHRLWEQPNQTVRKRGKAELQNINTKKTVLLTESFGCYW